MPSNEAPSRRADALRNIEAILDAATVCLARDPEASVNDIARAAGVGRVTIYGHFDSRAALVSKVVERAMADTELSLVDVDLKGEAPDVLARLVDVTWSLTHRYGSLIIAAEHSLTPAELQELHEAPTRRVLRILRRGRREGTIRSDMPLAWQIITFQGLLHAAQNSVYRGELDEAAARHLVRDTVLAALIASNADDVAGRA